RVDEYLADARARGDRFSQTCVGSGSSVVTWLIRDDPAAARALLDEEVAERSASGFQLKEYLALQGMTYVDLYEGRGEQAYRRLVEQWPTMRRSLLLRVELLRRTMWALRARAALSAGDPGALGEISKQAARLEATEVPSGRAMALLLRGAVADRRGESEDAVALFRESAAQLEALDMLFKAAVAERRCGELLGGDEGAAMVAHSEAAMRKQGIAEPSRMAALVLPGRA
ncbi:MAG: hypothetical protein JRI23_22620, partial [Deltaproteobacteria bacterium]|nr:hypothetical protein [Deltaproteobacteria bacterium]MBW2534760.1 hypothetical protein [Deltaproteobacteria bacterium]